MTKKINIAIVGATGVVGETVIKILEQRQFPIDKLFLLASEDSAGKRIMFNGKAYAVQIEKDFDFSQVDLVLMSVAKIIAKEIATRAIAQGAIVIDNSSAFRYENSVPLVVPEINFDAIKKEHQIIANPNCSTIQMSVVLKPIYEHFGIKRINVSTYQSVSGAGQKAINELAAQTGNLLNARPIEPDYFPQQIAFNVLPQIDELQENGYSREEMKMHWETQKIFDDDQIYVNATAVRVPVFYGHAEAIHLETAQPYDLEIVKSLLENAEGIELTADQDWPTPFKNGNDTDDVYVGRLRRDHSHPNGLNLWIVADNIRKGAALNAIQIAEKLFK